MVAIPPRPEQQVIDRIYQTYKRDEPAEFYLGRLGSSFIGEECVRRIWLDWRGFAREEFEGRMLRLFGTGHWQEARIVEDLRRAGFEVWDKNEQGQQFEFVDATGHLVTKMDGVVRGIPDSEKTPHALEIKTHNKNSFADLKKYGVARSKPTHYAQVQITMALSKLARTLYIAVCKDDEQLYVERIKEDRPAQEVLQQKTVRIVNAKLRPAGISDDGSSHTCRYCSMKNACLKTEPPPQHCRTCYEGRVEANGEWACGKTNTVLTLAEQRAGCADWSPL